MVLSPLIMFYDSMTGQALVTGDWGLRTED